MDRPSSTSCSSHLHSPEEWAGESIEAKIARLRTFIGAQQAQYYITNDASEIAWLLNLRGEDISYNPVFLAYLIVGTEEVHLFITEDHLTPEVREYLKRVNNHLITLTMGSQLSSNKPLKTSTVSSMPLTSTMLLQS